MVNVNKSSHAWGFVHIYCRNPYRKHHYLQSSNTAWKVSKYGVISGPYFLYSDWIRTRNNSVFRHFSRSVNNRHLLFILRILFEIFCYLLIIDLPGFFADRTVWSIIPVILCFRLKLTCRPGNFFYVTLFLSPVNLWFLSWNCWCLNFNFSTSFTNEDWTKILEGWYSLLATELFVMLHEFQ